MELGSFDAAACFPVVEMRKRSGPIGKTTLRPIPVKRPLSRLCQIFSGVSGQFQMSRAADRSGCRHVVPQAADAAGCRMHQLGIEAILGRAR